MWRRQSKWPHRSRLTRWGRRFNSSLFDLLEPALRRPQIPRRVRVAESPRVEIDRLPIRLRRSREVVLLGGYAAQRAGRAREYQCARPIPIGQLHGLALPSRVAETLRLLQRVGAAIDVLEAVDERPHQPEKRIGPRRTEFGGLAEC